MTTASQAAAQDSERRVAPRTRILKSGKILFNNRFSTFDCTVRNISATGALLTIDPAVPLPKVFEIRIGEDEAVRPAKLVYRRDTLAGIHFLDALDEEGETAPTAAPAAVDSDLRIHPRPLPAVSPRNCPGRPAEFFAKGPVFSAGHPRRLPIEALQTRGADGAAAFRVISSVGRAADS